MPDKYFQSEEFKGNPINNVFVARQPIFDADRRVYAYELLFRSGFKNFYDPNQDGNVATSKVISNSFLILGIESITAGKMAFVNFPRKLLVEQVPSGFSRDLMGIEIASNALFMLAILFMFAISLHFSMLISRLTDQSKMLAQRIALLDHELRRVRENRDGAGEPPVTDDD